MKGKVVLVTGASRGIGRATAIEFAKQGANVVVNYDKSKDKADQVVEEIKKLGQKAIAVQTDVSNPEQVKQMIEKTINEFGRLDVLVNNAGIGTPAALEQLKKENMARVLGVNLIGLILCCKEAAPHLLKNKGSSIINVASIAGMDPIPEAIDYGASKAGIISVTKSLAKYLAPNVRVNAVAPGMIKTDLIAQLDDEYIKKAIKSRPLRRLGEPEEVAKLIIFLTSENASYITGDTIICDGGYFMR